VADDEKMDEAKVHEALGKALQLQYRSALLYAVASGAVGGLDGLGVASLLAENAAREIEDVQRLADKLLAVNGSLPSVVPDLPDVNTDVRAALETIVRCEQECLEALHAVIEPSGQEARSEALEHLMEHVMTRKQAQIDRICRALR
jgi:ferritin-like protein